MKIGLTTFGGDGGKSGISQYIIRLLEQFATSANEDSIDVLVYDPEASLFVPSSSTLSARRFRPSLKGTLRNLLWHQVCLPRWCARESYEVLFLPAGNRRLPAVSPCPTVGTVHDFSSIHVAGKYDRLRYFYITKVLPPLIRRLSRVLTVSESSKRDIVEYAQVPEERVVVTPLAADRAVYRPREAGAARAAVRSRHGVDRPYILYVSRIEHPGKNHVRLIESFERLKRVEELPHRLVLAGSDWFRAQEVHRAAASSAVANEIDFLGFVPDADLPDLYCGADLFVFPSLYEGFGLPLLEAMSCGVPVACSNVSSMPEVGGEAAILFDPQDVESICDAMRRVLNDGDLRSEMIRRGAERSDEFTWEATARRTLEVLHEAGREGARC